MEKLLFAKPQTLDEALRRMNEVKSDITDIGLQLSAPPEERDQQWEGTARRALRNKKREQAFLNECIAGFKQQAKGERELIGQMGNMNLITHLKAHSKLMGKFHDLLLAVEQHLIHETDETWELMQASVGAIRSIGYVSS